MKNPKIHIVSLGCAKNLVDSERILGRLSAAGAVVNAPAEEADIILVNTCGFIQPAKEESIETILNMARHKREGRCRKLVVMGCLAQRYAPEIRKQVPEADGVFGLAEEDAILAACGYRAGAGRRAGRFLLTPKHTAYVRIADGCDNRCAYCAIPSIRGPFRSRPAKEIIREARGLIDVGAKEINLIGQDTSLYGDDLAGAPRIHDLLGMLGELRGLRWLRLLYTHPAHFSAELIEAYRSVKPLVPYVDLPLQHLNDDILHRMGRRVTQTQVLRLIDRIRARVPGVAIRTSLIVGFPGETAAQFKELLRLVEQLRFEHLGVFTFSREEGTRAARMPNQVAPAIARRRRGEIMAAQQQIAFARNKSLIGQVAQALIEAPAPHNSWLARTPQQAPDVDSVTFVKNGTLKQGQIVSVRITDFREYDLLAKPL